VDQSVVRTAVERILDFEFVFDAAYHGVSFPTKERNALLNASGSSRNAE
jgi:hypothetical protein